MPSADQIRKSTKLELEMGEQLTRLELEGQFGRTLLVLLTQRMVSLIDLLIEHRDKVGISQNNVYLFARIEGPSFVRGLDCLRRAAVECGVVNPEALLCPSLRQQIAISWQLLSLCHSDPDQVSKMLGRGIQECSQLSQNATVLEEVTREQLQMNQGLPSSSTDSPKEGAHPKCAVKRRPWSEQEQAAVKRFLSEFITKMKVPGKKECNACLAAEPDLCRRSWTDIKNFVHNTLQTLRRRQNQPEKPKPEKTAIKPKRKKAVTQSARKHCEVTNNSDSNLMANLEDTLPAPSHVEQSEMFSLDMPSGYVSFGSANSDMVYTNPTCSFSSPNVLETQVLPTYTQLGTTHTVMQLYSPENRFLPPMSPSNPQHPSSIPLPSDYGPQDAETSSAFSSLNCPSTPITPTYTTLNTAVFPPYSAINDRNDFASLDHSCSFYSTSPLTPITCSQVVPAEEGMSAEHLGSLVLPHQSNALKVSSVLLNEEDQGTVRRQQELFENQGKVAVKKDTCLTAESAMNRTWKEVKYFVHNSAETGNVDKQGITDIVTKEGFSIEPYTQTSHNDWEPPVYLSL